MKTPIKKNMLTAWLCLLITAVYAQKLPKVQVASIRAPIDIKIDGRAAEWGNKLQAYNNNVEFFYTISNDDKNLYLTVQVPEKEIVRRILNGGITFMVSDSEKMKDKNSWGITFPMFDVNNRFAPRFGGALGIENHTGKNTLTGEERASMIMVGGRVGTQLTLNQADSLMNDNNRNFLAKAKNIGVKGIKDVDSLISIYNSYGIKVAATFDNKATYTYELAVPLRYLPTEPISTEKITYHVIINEIKLSTSNLTEIVTPNGALIKPMALLKNSSPAQDATDFWGEYTLAKK